MKKIYMILAALTLLSMSLNAQTTLSKYGDAGQPKSQTGKVNAPNRATVTGSVTAADGTATSTGYQYLPVYGYYFEQAQTTQMIYTATQLDGLQTGDKITSLTFYPRTQSGSVGTIGFSSGSITLSLGNTSISEFSSNSALSVSTTQVARVTSYPVSNGAWTITFTTPFVYTGGNILVQVNTTSGNYGTTYFFGQDQSNYQSRNSYGSTNRYYFLPKIKLDYERSDDPEISASPTSVSLSSIPGATSDQTVTVSGLNLTGGITATISGTDASVFGVNPASLGTSGGSLTVTYSPTAVGTHTATLTLSSTGAQDVTVTLNGTCTQDLTLCDGTETNGNLPIYGLYIDDYQINQMIYPEITSLIGKKLTSMTFYATTALDAKLSSVGWNVKLGTTTQNSFADALSSITRLVPDNATTVEGYVITSGINTMTITFDTPFEYNGGNLLVDFQSTAEGQWASTSFYGVNQNTVTGYNSYLDGNSTPNQNGHYSGGAVQRFLPKVTFTYEDSQPRHDLAITLSEPTAVVAGETATITATVTNHGNQTESGYTVTFSDGTNTFSTQTGGTLAPGATETFTATYTTSAAGTVTITANVACTDDATPSDNTATTNLTVNAQVHDLGITLSAPAEIVGGNSATVTATVTNNGNQPMAGYTVTITDGTNTLLTQTVNEALAPGATATFDATYATTEAQVGTTVNFTATVACTGDEDATNNSATASTAVITLPPPENVVATVNSDQVSATVTWDAPSNSAAFPLAPTTLIWDFEEQADFADFTTIDNDGDGYNWNWYTNVGASSTLITHDDSDGVIYSQSYDKPTTTALTPDNWLISPEINLGGEVSFWACGQDSQQWWNEVFAVYVCVGQYNSVDDFIKVSPDYTTTHDMTQYTCDLSQYQGQGYFAIRHYNVTDQFYLNVDDITCETFAPAPPVSYKIYLDGEYVATVPSTTDPLSYDFGTLAAGTHVASVSAVYANGAESAATPSNEFTILGKTDAPEISVVPGETAYTITATAADPNAEVVMTINGEEYRGTGSVSVSVDRGTTDKNVNVSATAQEQGKLESDPAEQNVTVPALPITPTPTITYETTGGTVVITATGEGTVYLEVDGRVVSGEGSVSITVMRSLEDRTVTATATAVADNHQPSAEAISNVPVPALAGDPAHAQEGLLRMHLLIVDQMKEEIPDDNGHPDRYGYILKWEQPANVNDRKQSGTVDVEIKKTEAQVNGYYTLTQVENDIDHDNSVLTMDVLTADVGMYLPGEDPDVLYYEMQAKQDENPALGEDYVTQLQYIKNAQKYEEMLPTSPNKTHQYPAEETYHYFDDSTPIVTGEYGVNFMTYAPSVSTWGIQRRYFEEDGLDNTYGAPIWKTGVGRVRMIHTEAQLQRGPQGSTQWDGVGGPCSLVFLGLEALGDLPSTDVTNIVYEPYMFRVWIQSPGNNLRGCNLIAADPNRPERPGEHWEGDGTSYGSVPVLVYEEETSDGHLYKDVQAPEVGNNVPWPSRIQFGALDAGLSDLIVYVRFYYKSTGEGISDEGSKYMLRGNRDGEGDETPEVPGYYATEDNDNPDVTTGFIELWNDFIHGEVVSTTYVNSLGMQSDQPFDGVNIVVTRYSDGTVRTTKVVR